MTTIVDRSSIIQIQKTANTQSEEPTVPNKDLEKNKKKGNLLVTKTVKMVDNQCPLLVSKKIKQSEDQVEKKFISNKKRINEAIKGKNKEKKIRKDGTKNSQEHEILAKLNETVSLDHLTARDNAKNQDNSNAKKIMEKITSSNSEMIPFHYFITVKLYELFPFLIIGQDNLDYDLPMLYVTKLTMSDEIDLDTDEERISMIKVKRDQERNHIETLDGSPIGMQLIDAAIWGSFLPKARSLPDN
uniref:Uncharacterized protein n=1 Tax=Loa loa TaxID=7209 RepID=A0A1I7W459_LOALO